MIDDPIFLGADRERPARADALQNRAEILEAAQRLFAEHGVQSVSMNQIACEAGVGKGTLYRHFRNKSDLCHALLDGEQRALQDRTFEYLRVSQESPQSLLQWFLRNLCNYIAANIALLVETTQERYADGRMDLAHPAHHWQWLTILGLLRQMPLDGDIEYLADVLYTLLDPRVYYFQHHVRGYEHSRIIDGILDTAERLIS